MSSINGAPASGRYWRSLEELADSPGFRRFVEAEFPALAEELDYGPTRRQFLKVMGASLALGGLTGCRWPKETIVPATKQPVDRIPGVPVQYATAMELGGAATGLLVTSCDGRPIKIEGNEKHPFSRGKTNAWMQASLLELYDRDRSQSVVRRSPAHPGDQQVYRTWNEFEAFAREHFTELRVKGGAGLAVLSETSSSPSLADMKDRFQAAFPQAQWYEYEPLSRDNEVEGARLAFGKPYRTHLHLDKTDVIVSLDSDFLMTHPAAVKYAGDFAARRRADDGTMNRLYVIESGLTVTGSMADHRYPVNAAGVVLMATRLLRELRSAGVSLPAADKLKTEPTDGFLAPLARELAAHAGRGLIVAGQRQSPAVHALAHLMNQALGNNGHTVTYTAEPEAPGISVGELRAALVAGRVETLVLLGGNPVYDAPADLEFAAALAKVKTSIHLSLFDDETSQACTWHLPRAHFLEAWGDARAYDGTVSFVQPLIEPLYGGRTPIEILALLDDDPLRSGHDITRRTFGVAQDGGEERETAWRRALHDGVVPGSQWPEQTAPDVNADWLAPLAILMPQHAATRLAPDGGAEDAFEVAFAPSYSLYDGRFANNAWLQELADPITKLTWDNAALISPSDAEKLGIKKYGDMLKIELAGRSLELPAYIVPGHVVGSITLPLGFGRGSAAGQVADGAGFDTYKLRTTGGMHFTGDAKVTATGRHYELATTQDHHAIDSQVGREETQKRIGVLIREASLSEYKHHPRFAEHVVHLPALKSLWQEKEYTGHKWGMAIDLSACIGCSACVAACQAENNVPVVGKGEVLKGREMHWIRVDRYFKTEARSEDELASRSPADIQVVHQPVTCVHCENAPCEQVCPVAATVHDSEGLNVQVYNRCVGTRYCSNNCPFKVRRFNWFYNHHGPYHPRSLKSDVFHAPGKLKQVELTDLEKMVNNPNVTVRSRGVMEKCTFCVQRINTVKIKAQNERWDSIPDGLITPACAQACPTDALVFGDLNDPHSRVRKLHDHPRAYEMLAELNIKARTRYLAKLRNPPETQA